MNSSEYIFDTNMSLFAGFDTLEVESYARGPFLLKGLEPSTLYCVWVRAERVGQNSPWVCASATTGQTGGELRFANVAYSEATMALASFGWLDNPYDILLVQDNVTASTNHFIH